MVNKASERIGMTEPFPLARRNVATVTRVGLRSGLLLFLLMFIGPVRGFSLETPQAASTEPFNQEVSVEIRDGLLTATFSDRTDDGVLRAALPALVSQGVQSINLHGSPVHDMRLIAGLSGLKALDLSGTQVRDLAPLAALTGLQSLNLQFLRISELRPLAGMTVLRTLNLGGTEVSDLTPLSGLTELRDLFLAVSKVKDLTPLSPLRQLMSLDLGSTRTGDMRPLAGLTHLRFLSLNGTPVADIQPLIRLVELRTLDLGATRVGDISVLAGMRDLRSLNLEGTSVADVTPLSSLPALRSVTIGGSLVRDTAPLAHLTTAAAAPANQPEPDPVLIWNDQANRAIQATRTDAFMASRALAIESIAVHDTIKSIDGAAAFLVRLPAPRDISANIAAAAAAHAALSHLFPTQHGALDRALAAALAREPVGPARARAAAFGRSVADAIILVRDEDGSIAFDGVRGRTNRGGPRIASARRAGLAPGEWRPTPPDVLPAAHVEWATMQPFVMTGSGQFRPPGPPARETPAYRQARADVAAVGEVRSTVRTVEQTEIAHYWSNAIGTYAPAGHWNAIAANIVAPLHLGMAVEAELFAELNVALADSGIAMADAKYTYGMWRPVTAIRSGDDVAPSMPDWTPLLETPNHPSYISGHSSFSGAAATVLTAWFGTRPFTFSSTNLPGVTRQFASFQQAAEEAAASRVYGGIHFGFDNADGLTTGRSVGAWTMASFGRPADDRGPFIMMMDRSVPLANKDPRAVIGCALDNLAPVTTVSVRLDGGAPFTVAVDDQGFFTLPPDRLAAPGQHAAVLTATSITGRHNSVLVSID